MRQLWFRIILVAMFVSVGVVSSFGVPFEMKYQGYIEVGGVPYTGMATTFFSLLDGPSSPTTNYWTNDNSHPTPGTRPLGGVAVTVSNGVFTLNLGDTTLNMYPIYSAVFAHDPVYLRFWYKAGSNKTVQQVPNEKIVSAGYALNAVRVGGFGVGHGLKGIPVNDYTLSTGLNADLLDGQHGVFYRNASNLNAGTIPSDRLAGSYTNASVDYANWAGNASSADNAISASSASNSNQLNGQPGSYYQDAGNLTGIIPAGRLVGDYGSATVGYVLDADKVDGIHATDFAKPLYDAIVAPTNGDYTTISDAIAAGKKTIFVRNGTYLEPDTITITQNGTSIIGESSGGVKIALQPYTGFKYSGGIYVSGYKGWYADGSCRVVQASATVTGSDVSWTSDMVGQCIQLGGEWYEISAYGDTSTLTLKQPYYGITSTYTEYIIAGFLTGLRLENLSIVSTGGHISGITLDYVKNAVVKKCTLSRTVNEGLYLNYTIESLIENNAIEGCGYYGCNLLYSDHNTIRGNIIKQNDGDGLYVYYSDNNTIIGNQITGNEKTGLVIYASDNNRIAENKANQNGDSGIWTILDEGNRLKNNVCSLNYSDGIYIDGSSNNSIVGCSATNNNNTGIYIESGSENTILVGCHAINNQGSNLYDGGTNTQKGLNYTP